MTLVDKTDLSMFRQEYQSNQVVNIVGIINDINEAEHIGLYRRSYICSARTEERTTSAHSLHKGENN